MVGIGIREFVFDIKDFFKGWKLIVLLIFIGIAIIVSKTEEEVELGSLMIFFVIWTCLSMKPKINKLHYLLPGEEKSRQTYILIKCLSVFIFNIVWYIMSSCIMGAVVEYHFKDELKTFLCEVLPFLITYASINMNTGFNLAMLDKDYWNEKYQSRYSLSMALILVPILNTSLLSHWLTGVWYYTISIISGLCAIVILYCQITLLKHNDTGYENIRKVEKLFS